MKRELIFGLLLLLWGCKTSIEERHITIPIAYEKSEKVCLEDSVRQAYRKEINAKVLLDNSKIRQGIELNPLVKSKSYKEILHKKIEELEKNNISSWGDYRKKSEWNEEESLELYLQKVALMIYVEAKGSIPWSILDYNREEFDLLLSDGYVEDHLPDQKSGGYYFAREQAVFNGNPLIAFNYMTETRQRYPCKEIKNQKDLLDLVITRMRDDEWTHFSDNDSEQCGNFVRWDLECLLGVKKGSDIFMSEVLYALLQSEYLRMKWF